MPPPMGPWTEVELSVEEAVAMALDGQLPEPYPSKIILGLIAEVRRLRSMANILVERVEIQSRLLSRKAERADDGAT